MAGVGVRLGRRRCVWLSLLAATTLTAGGLTVVQGPPAPRSDGIALAAPVSLAPMTTDAAVMRTRSPLDRERWKRIVIHQSGSVYGSPETIATQHEAHGRRGLGHHFVIGNGKGAGDGELYIGYRWLDQQPGAHASGPEGDWHNLHSISICLVGDGDRRPFTDAQVRRLSDLLETLCRGLGLSERDVLLYGEVAAGGGPGRLFPEAAVRQRLSLAVGSAAPTADR